MSNQPGIVHYKKIKQVTIRRLLQVTVYPDLYCFHDYIVPRIHR